jgi:hypothetical protein
MNTYITLARSNVVKKRNHINGQNQGGWMSFIIDSDRDGVYVVRKGILFTTTSIDSLCFGNAIMRNQPTFTLVGQDMLAVETIDFWRKLLVETKPTSKKIKMVEDDIARFTEFADINRRVMKVPD